MTFSLNSPTRGTPRNDAFVIFKIAISLRKLLDWIVSERNSRISKRKRAQEISVIVAFNVLPLLMEDNSKSDASSIAVPPALRFSTQSVNLQGCMVAALPAPAHLFALIRTKGGKSRKRRKRCQGGVKEALKETHFFPFFCAFLPS
jgi:hypothetical protein